MKKIIKPNISPILFLIEYIYFHCPLQHIFLKHVHAMKHTNLQNSFTSETLFKYPSLPVSIPIPDLLSSRLLHLVGTCVFLPVFLSCLLKILLDLPLPPHQPFLLDHSDLGTDSTCKADPMLLEVCLCCFPWSWSQSPIKNPTLVNHLPTCWSTHLFSLCLGLLGIQTQHFNKNFKS